MDGNTAAQTTAIRNSRRLIPTTFPAKRLEKATDALRQVNGNVLCGSKAGFILGLAMYAAGEETDFLRFQYSSANMTVITRSVTVGSPGSGE